MDCYLFGKYEKEENKLVNKHVPQSILEKNGNLLKIIFFYDKMVLYE
ncbi:MAG TPA: hypothetical protein PLM63_04110 [bacterium]|nr:hypothetical protein [bacterium]